MNVPSRKCFFSFSSVRHSGPLRWWPQHWAGQIRQSPQEQQGQAQSPQGTDMPYPSSHVFVLYTRLFCYLKTGVKSQVMHNISFFNGLFYEVSSRYRIGQVSELISFILWAVYSHNSLLYRVSHQECILCLCQMVTVEINNVQLVFLKPPDPICVYFGTSVRCTLNLVMLHRFDQIYSSISFIVTRSGHCF